MRVRVKICGMTRAADVDAAAHAGADAIGLVFHAASPRALTATQARSVVAGIAPFVTTVALFVDPSRDEVLRVIDTVRPDLLQFHGAEQESFCAGFGVPWMKAIRVGGQALEESALARDPGACALLVDRWDPVQAGGTGRSFDWSLLPARTRRRIVLAGGLDAGNVGAGIAALRPFAVDVSTGVESAPGLKDAGRIRDFMQAVREAEAALAAGEGETQR